MFFEIVYTLRLLLTIQCIQSICPILTYLTVAIYNRSEVIQYRFNREIVLQVPRVVCIIKHEQLPVYAFFHALLVRI